MQKERQRVKKFALKNAGKTKRHSLETRTTHRSEKATWPRCVPRRHTTMNVENITPRVRKLFKKKKKKKTLSYSSGRLSYGRPRNKGAADGPENILVHQRRMINKDGVEVSPAQEKLLEEDSTVVL